MSRMPHVFFSCPRPYVPRVAGPYTRGTGFQHAGAITSETRKAGTPREVWPSGPPSAGHWGWQGWGPDCSSRCSVCKAGCIQDHWLVRRPITEAESASAVTSPQALNRKASMGPATAQGALLWLCAVNAHQPHVQGAGITCPCSGQQNVATCAAGS